MLCPIKMHKAEKYAVNMNVLSEETRTFLMKNFGCYRKVYNLYVSHLYAVLESMNYEGNAPIPDIVLPSVKSFKEEYSYLKEADSLGLADARTNFTQAVKHYNEDCDHKSYTKKALRRSRSGAEPLSFRGLKGMPRFQSRNGGDFSYTTYCQYPNENSLLKRPTVRLEKDTLIVPKLKNGLKLIIHRPLPDDAVIGNVTLSMDIDGRFYAAINYSYILDMEMDLRYAALNDDTSILPDLKILGLDYSQQDFYVDSDGKKANYPHYYEKSEAKLVKYQRQLARMEYKSKNYIKKLKQIRKLNLLVRNQRKDFARKLAAMLASEYDIVAVEDINLRNMGEALSLGKNLHDNGFGMFRTFLSQKLEANGSILVKVDKWYPSTKTCHCCGCHNPDVVLGVNEWTCPSCGTHHDRDHNAAINIREEGRRTALEYFRHWLEEDKNARERAEKRTNARKRKRSVAA